MSVNLSELSDQIAALQEKVDKIKTAAKAKTGPLEEQIAGLEEQLFLAMEDAGVSEIKSKKSKADIKESLRVNFDDPETFFNFCIRNKALHLFERRIAINAYREMKESLGNKPVPGLREFTQKKLKVGPV